MSRNKKNAVAFAKPEDPAFLRRMKQQLGYKDGPSVDTKRETLPQCEIDDLEDKDDEKPTIVVLKHGDLTEEEFEKIVESEPSVEEGGRIMFKKPVKRTIEEKPPNEDETKKVKIGNVKESTSKKVKDKSLLSFDDEEDDDFS